MSTVTDNRKNTLTTLVAAFVLINFTASSVLAATGISDYRYTVSLSRAGILVAVILAAYFVGSALYRRKINTKLLITVTISAGSAIVFVMLDLIRYSLFPPMIQSTELYTRIGVFIFLSVFSIYIIDEYSRMRIETGKAQVMSELAYSDALTGLLNRQVLNETEQQIRAMSESCYIIQLDINDLKLVNDIHGHKEGDRHIKGAASVILDSFYELGTCFRSGGDEFMVISKIRAKEKEVKDAIERMHTLVDHYNYEEHPPIPLRIAAGYALCSNPSVDLDNAEIAADKFMYADKKKLKEKSAAENRDAKK